MPHRDLDPKFTVVASLVVSLLVTLASDTLAEYPVGTSDETFVDPDRNDRPVPADLYYPGQSAGPDAPVADPPPESFAAVAFGHGYQISASAYAWIAERLAAAGCVVAVARTGSGLFPDHGEFGLDLAFLVRALRDAGDDAGSPFYGRMGPRTLVMGHSMGGGCSVLAAAGDPSVTAVANFAAAETNPSAIASCAGLDRPTLLIAGTNDCVTPPADHQLPMYGALAGWRTLVTIDGASHCQFNAYSFLCALGEFCSADISREVQQALVWTLLEPWVKSVLFLDSVAAQEFQALLGTGAGFTYLQDGPTAARAAVPRFNRLVAAFPNPFNVSLAVRVDVVEAGNVELAIFDVAGRRVRTLVDRPLAASRHTFRWGGRDDAGRELPSGVYVARLRTNTGEDTVKLVRVR